MNIEIIHPMVVHFPIALLICSIFFDIFALITRKERFEYAAFYILLLGVLGAVVAIFFGLMAEERVEQQIKGIKPALETHELMAFTTTIIFSALLGFRYMMKTTFKRLRWSYVIVSIIATILLVITAFLGGRLVYEHGAAVKVSAIYGHQNI